MEQGPLRMEGALQHHKTTSSKAGVGPSSSPRRDAEGGPQTLRQACCREKPESAMCVQNLDDSRGLAIRITYRISLRSSSLWEPRHPPLKVVRYKMYLGWCGRGKDRSFDFHPPPPLGFRSFRSSRVGFSPSCRKIRGVSAVDGGRQCARTRTPTRQPTDWSEKGDAGEQRLPAASRVHKRRRSWIGVVMILPQVHLRKPCYDFTFL